MDLVFLYFVMETFLGPRFTAFSVSNQPGDVMRPIQHSTGHNERRSMLAA